ATAVLKLSSIMRYILAETEQRLVPLQNEIDFIHNYIELQQVRLTNKVKVHFDVSGNTGELLVAPLIFIAFVENAFKYGISTKEESV
ncbi:histidine kinase, partial [Shewanella algae]|uniref:histidine kinase n=1 Tax=Shewanella algae TaxID=38313 RepID=UPI00313AD51A